MNEIIRTTNIGPELSDAEQGLLRKSIRDSLEKTDKGGTANTIMNCVAVYEQDPVFAGKISRNLLTETDDITGPMPWQRDGTRFDDRDLPHVLLHFEQYYGIRSEKSIQLPARSSPRVLKSAPENSYRVSHEPRSGKRPSGRKEGNHD